MFNIDGFDMDRMGGMAKELCKRRKDRIVDAHTKYMVALIGCMSDNPAGVRQFVMLYEDFMRIEAGAEVALRD